MTAASHNKRSKCRLILFSAIVIAVVGLVVWVSMPSSKPDLLIQGRPVRIWLQEVEIGGFPDKENPALEVLVSARAQAIPLLCEILAAFESPKDAVMRLPNWIVPPHKKSFHANESASLTIKAQAAHVMGVIAYRHPDFPEVRNAIPTLTSSLRSGSPIVRYLSAQALGAAGKAATNSVPALIARTVDENSGVRFSAVEALGRIGMNTPEVAAAITQALADSEGGVRETATLALQKLRQATPSQPKK